MSKNVFVCVHVCVREMDIDYSFKPATGSVLSGAVSSAEKPSLNSFLLKFKKKKKAHFLHSADQFPSLRSILCSADGESPSVLMNL